MSTASGLPAEDLASKLLGTKEGRSGLEAFFTPQNIAVIGATEKAGSIGRTIVWNLMKSPFGGPIFPVNPKRRSVLGIKAHPRIGDVPDLVDLAIVVTPAPTVPDLIGECVEAGVRAAIVASAGFKEIGAEGEALERRIMDQAGRGRMRVIGPNSLGLRKCLEVVPFGRGVGEQSPGERPGRRDPVRPPRSADRLSRGRESDELCLPWRPPEELGGGELSQLPRRPLRPG